MTQRFGYVAIVGIPNVGKSSLVNRWIGQKVSIVSPKPQTTRIPIVGIGIHGQAQIVFLDTPGIFDTLRGSGHSSENRAMLRAAWKTLGRAHGVCVVVDPSQSAAAQQALIVKLFERCELSKVLILNKIDIVPKASLLARTAEHTQDHAFEKVFMVSARTQDGVQDVMDFWARNLPEQPWIYSEDQISTLPQRFLAEEMTREQIFLQINQEIPYGIHIQTERWEPTLKGGVKIYQVIYIQKTSQKAILLGHQGQRIRAIGTAARIQLERLLQQPIHLFLHLKVSPQEAQKQSFFEISGESSENR